MSIFTIGRYNINLKNKAYIQAIAKYNQKSLINEARDMNGELLSLEMPKGKNTLLHLENLIKQVQGLSDKVIVTYQSHNSSTLAGVFLPVKKTEKNHECFNLAASKYLETLIFNATNEGPLRPCMALPELPAALSKNEAKYLIEQYDCSGAIMLAGIKTFLFEYKDACFYLTYGKTCRIGQAPIVLDLDEGFVCQVLNGRGQKEVKKDKHIVKIINSLQAYFKQWKEKRHYEGTLFPANIALNVTESPEVSAGPLKMGFFKSFTFPFLYSHKKMNSDNFMTDVGIEMDKLKPLNSPMHSEESLQEGTQCKQL